MFGIFATSICYGADDTKVIVDDSMLECDAPTQIVNGRILVPLRAIFEAIGAEVQ